MWRGKSVSVVLMTYAEKDSIGAVIQGFEELEAVDEIVVINNNAEEGTAEEVAATSARQVFEPHQGYGFASRRGLAEARGDLIVLVEPDGTFLPRDVEKLLAYSDDCDAVFGTRTSKQFIGKNANMGRPLRWGNRLVAKLMMLLFGADDLTDVGCTYRLLTRELVDEILPQLKVGGSQMGPELMMQVILSGAKYVEVPINYRERVGVSSVTGQLHRAVLLGAQMVMLICKTRWTAGRTEPSDTVVAAAQRTRPTSGSPIIDLRDESPNETHGRTGGRFAPATAP